MILCGICRQDIEEAVSLPCGHIFCEECVSRAVDAIREYSTLHFCPSCHSAYSIIPIDPATVDMPLRPHLIPSVRRLYYDSTFEGPRTLSSAAEIAVENARLNAENMALRRNCQLWRKRAEAHSASTLNLLRFATTARDEVIKTRQEQDKLYAHYRRVKARLGNDSGKDSYVLPPTPTMSIRHPVTPVPHMPRLLLSSDSAHVSRHSSGRRSSSWTPPSRSHRVPRIVKRVRSEGFASLGL